MLCSIPFLPSSSYTLLYHQHKTVTKIRVSPVIKVETKEKLKARYTYVHRDSKQLKQLPWFELDSATIRELPRPVIPGRKRVVPEAWHLCLELRMDSKDSSMTMLMRHEYQEQVRLTKTTTTTKGVKRSVHMTEDIDAVNAIVQQFVNGDAHTIKRRKS